MSEYRLTKDTDADLLDVFLYGLETFGLTRALPRQLDYLAFGGSKQVRSQA